MNGFAPQTNDFDYIKNQEKKWSDLGYSSLMRKSKANYAPTSYISSDEFDGLVDDGSITANKLRSINADRIIAGFISAQRIEIGTLEFTSTLVWTATDQDTASWSAGSIKFSDGSKFNITSGNTGNIATVTYVYFDSEKSTTALQTTTDSEVPIGAKKRLMAIISLGADSDSKCAIEIPNSQGTVLEADRITTGTLSSSYVNVGSGTGGAFVRLDGNNNRIIINDGSFNRILIGKQVGGF